MLISTIRQIHRIEEVFRTAANQYGLNVSGTQVVAAVYTAAEAGNKATSCEALTLTPVVAESVVLNAKTSIA